MKFGYNAEFTGVGQAPQGHEESIGFCTQIGVFHRLPVNRDGHMLADNAEDHFPYTLVSRLTRQQHGRGQFNHNILLTVSSCKTQDE